MTAPEDGPPTRFHSRTDGIKQTMNAAPTPTTIRCASRRRLKPDRAVVTCYDFFDRIFPACGLDDFTEGIYAGDPTVSHEQAQRRQLDYLLDQVGCGPASRLLDIGCGSGSLLDRARRRGAHAVGINISPRQVARCRARGLKVYLLDYRHLTDDWSGQFDAIVANGSAEHFVQPADAITGRAGNVYARMFAICHRLLDPASSSRRFVTTIIHFGRVVPDPHDMVRSPFRYRPGSDRFHAAMLEHTLGGFYPVTGALQRTARPYFELVEEVDGTDDYRLTSEEWLRRVRHGLLSFRPGVRIWADLIPFLLRHPHQSLLTLLLVLTQSWQWQFRGERPPTRLLRQTWQAR